ncbi:hypothetical protein KGF57_001108 [Candida theae]|uniref:Uncharacterized protein n=1 Tax=Candida theae TaxID=1198502 RepID=A0AAD5BI36_9ASCO|nr:uncharacterized protein KGF57_001108 [Candida theae]KAI5963997.1 hypothetical protein KGF57_001108 [Candida theae]
MHQLTINWILLALPIIITAVSGSPMINNNNGQGLDKVTTTHNSSTSLPILLKSFNNTENGNNNNNNNNNNNSALFATIQGTKLERESASSGWQINAGVYLEKSIGDGHSTMWESSSDDDSSDDDDGWGGWANRAGKTRKKKFSMLSHNVGGGGACAGVHAGVDPGLQLGNSRAVVDVRMDSICRIGNGTFGTTGNGSSCVWLYSYDGVVGIAQAERESSAEMELVKEKNKFKSKKQHSWSEVGDNKDNHDGVVDDDNGEALRSEANYTWNKFCALGKVYLFILCIVLVG